MKKSFLGILAMLLIMASCSNDELVNDVVPDANEQKNTIGKTFNMELVSLTIDNSPYTRNDLCCDIEGNFYFFDSSKDRYSITIKKYNRETKEISEITSLPDNGLFYGSGALCVDHLQNIYCTDGNSLYRVSPDGSQISNLTSHFGGLYSDCLIFYGLCAAENGNVFISVATEYEKGSIFKIAANGKLSTIKSGIDFSVFDFKGSGLLKPKGGFVYGVQGRWLPKDYIKLNTGTAALDSFVARPNTICITAALNIPQAYGMTQNSIYQLRPNTAQDLLIGSLPTYIKDENGNLVEVLFDEEFCTNPDATEFYAMLKIKRENGYFYPSGVYKLTLN